MREVQEYRLVGNHPTRGPWQGPWREGEPSDNEVYDAIHTYKDSTDVCWELRVTVYSDVRRIPLTRPESTPDGGDDA